MEIHGSKGPKPYRRRQTSTVFVRVPRAEWAAVKCGSKREFRAGSGQHSALWNVATPCPAVAYTINIRGEYDRALIVLENVWREPLGAISEESLAAEGFATFPEFRRAWMLREKRRFPPLRMTMVYRVRPWTDKDAAEMGDALLGHLRGLPTPPGRTPYQRSSNQSGPHSQPSVSMNSAVGSDYESGHREDPTCRALRKVWPHVSVWL